MDKIFITDLKAHGIIGLYEHERLHPQDILINISLQTDTKPASLSDDLADCINYDALGQQIKHLAETAQRLTVEALAEDIANLCLQHSLVEKVCVRVEKPHAVNFARSVGVEIERVRS